MTPLTAGLNLANGIISVIDQLVEDKDLASQLKLKALEQTVEYNTAILTSESVPIGVKYLLAFRDIVIPLLRPVGSAALSAFAAYAAVKGITLDPVVQAAFAGAFPGWMASRHVRLKQQEITKQEEAKRAAEDKRWDALHQQ